MPTYAKDYQTPFTCPACPHPYHGDTACQAKTENGKCRCDA